MHSLSVGEVYQWKVVEKDAYYCAAEWKQYFSSWYGFEVPRDENHGTVYSLMKEDGVALCQHFSQPPSTTLFFINHYHSPFDHHQPPSPFFQPASLLNQAAKALISPINRDKERAR